MPEPASLTEGQQQAAAYRGPADRPLVILGGAGTGKTSALVARFAALIAEGSAPDSVLVLAGSPRAADALRPRLEEAIHGPYEELRVTTVPGFCAQLLGDEALEAGIDPFSVPLTASDRLAMLLDRISELPLRRHDLRGNPAALLASVVARIDRLKDQLISPAEYAGWAARLPEDDDAARARAAREREFAEIYRQHDRMLAERGALDTGDQLAHALRLLRDRADVRDRVAERHRHVLVDEFEELGHAQVALLWALVAGGAQLAVAADDDSAIVRPGGAAAKNVRDLLAGHPDSHVVTLVDGLRCPGRVLAAADAVIAPATDRLGTPLHAAPGEGDVEFWRCANDRAQAQGVAADIERLIAEGVAPERIAVLVRSARNEGRGVAVALEERSVPHRVVGASALFQRAEIRDLLAWLRLLVDTSDAGAVVRALARPPIELRSIDLARCTQIARRRKLDMVSALVAATESPQLPPEARERVLRFLKLHKAASGALDTARPDLFVHRLIERLGLRRQQLYAASPDVAERLVNLARFGQLAADHVRREPQATAREFASHIAAVAEAGVRDTGDSPEGAALVPGTVAVMAIAGAKGIEFDHVYVLGLHAGRMPGARKRSLEPVPEALLREPLPPDTREAHVSEMRRLMHVAITRARERAVLAYPQASESGAAQQPSPFLEEARAALRADWTDHEEQLFGPAETLHATYRMLRDELLETVSRVGGRLGELRFDTELDVSHAVVRYLEVVKLAALIERAQSEPGLSTAEALREINTRLLQAVTSEQREIYESSQLDDYLLDVERSERRRAAVVAGRDEPTLEAFLPRRGDGLVLSASDIETYRTCPLKYKFARVFRIPTEPTLNQRFGILVHQVLERFHAGGGERTLSDLLGLLDAGWRRGGFGESDEERQLSGKARTSLTRYWEGLRGEDAEPIWFERSFAFPLGPHLVRGRVDRVDRLADGGYELIDYKTGRPKSAAQLKEDVQLSLYAVGAREAWQLDAASQAYYYVLDNEKVPVPRDERDRDWITDTVMEVAEGILGQGFEPTPSFGACSMCDFRIICPASER